MGNENLQRSRRKAKKEEEQIHCWCGGLGRDQASPFPTPSAPTPPLTPYHPYFQKIEIQVKSERSQMRVLGLCPGGSVGMVPSIWNTHTNMRTHMHIHANTHAHAYNIPHIYVNITHMPIHMITHTHVHICTYI